MAGPDYEAGQLSAVNMRPGIEAGLRLASQLGANARGDLMAVASIAGPLDGLTVGAQVRLRSGGPVMTVSRVHGDGKVRCTYWAEPRQAFDELHADPATLVAVKD